MRGNRNSSGPVWLYCTGLLAAVVCNCGAEAPALGPSPSAEDSLRGGTAAAQAAVTADSVADAGPAAVPYGPGERLVFSIDFGPINAGEASLEVKGLIGSEGALCYEIESRARSNRFFSTFYKVRDKVISHIDVHGLFSRFFAKRLREGTFKRNIEYTFDQTAGKVHYADGAEFDIIPGSHDVLSAFYFVRTLELEPGIDHWITTHSSHRNYELRVIVHRRERIEVSAGTFDCLVVEPVIEGEGLFKQEGALTIWLTDDAHRLPVLMRTQVKVGSIDATLKEYQLGRPLQPDEWPEGSP